MSDRVLNTASLCAIALAATCLLIAVITISTVPADGATCAKRPGISSGKVWWRWRIDRSTGARCWYPGTKYASRRVHSRPAMLRRVAGETRTDAALPVEVPLIRSVRAVEMWNGVTANERVGRSFDKLLIFPVVEED